MLHARTATLDIAYELSGPADGPVVVLLHGFPDDVRVWDEVAAPLAQSGCRVYAPWLRGYGPTRFLDDATPRSGQQAALGDDLRAFMVSCGIARATLAGYDWGGRAACIVAALWPERVHGLVTIGGYNIQNIATSEKPAPAAQELRFWYQWYLHTARGRAGLHADRRGFCRLLWQMWSPDCPFDEALFACTAESWDNPDFVDVVVQSYRHRHGAAAGDPALEWIEQRLATMPMIEVPTIALQGESDGVDPPDGRLRQRDRFTRLVAHRVVPGAGHFMPREAPAAVVEAVQRLLTVASY